MSDYVFTPSGTTKSLAVSGTTGFRALPVYADTTTRGGRSVASVTPNGFNFAVISLF